MCEPINPAGTALIYSTYLGGSSYNDVYGLAVDSTGAAWVTGDTGPAIPGPECRPSTSGGNEDTYAVRLDTNGNLLFSTFLGGSGSESGAAIAVDSSNNGYARVLNIRPVPHDGRSHPNNEHGCL